MRVVLRGNRIMRIPNKKKLDTDIQLPRRVKIQGQKVNVVMYAEEHGDKAALELLKESNKI